MKTCKMCLEIKNLNDFFKASKHKDGLFSYCKKCSLEKTRNWRRNNPEKAKAQSRRSKRTQYENSPETVIKNNEKWKKK